MSPQPESARAPGGVEMIDAGAPVIVGAGLAGLFLALKLAARKKAKAGSDAGNGLA